VRGPRGTVVVLGVLRGGARLDLAMHRDQVRTRSVSGEMLPDGVGLVRLARFQKRTVDEVSEVLAQLRDERGGPLAGIVVDLRDNPGGYLRQAVAVADLWLADGTIVSTIDRGEAAQQDRAQALGTDKETPLVVLINAGSASAAEILAGALQDLHRATVVGYTSYGKGSVQQFFELSDGSALKLTTARYLTPSGRSIHGLGITPDIAFADADGPFGDDRLAPLFALHPADAAPLDGDPELHAAWAVLRDPDAAKAWSVAARTPPPD
jgi:carboxyl-terminal processing protease